MSRSLLLRKSTMFYAITARGLYSLIDPKLMDYLYDLLTEVGNHGEVHIISGYRAPEPTPNCASKAKELSRVVYTCKGKPLIFVCLEPIRLY